MASVFTYDPDPPRVSSPWLRASTPVSQDGQHRISAGFETPQAGRSADCGISKLEPEPQEGPTEYKLHLLLRPRQSFSTSSTGQKVSGSYLSKPKVARSERPVMANMERSSSAVVPNLQSRQNRLQHLTTQLLWRLQQSSPYHSSSAGDLVLPLLPEATLKLSLPSTPGRLPPGLEESQGALYEIGVSDDGTFVGLVESEMEESLTNLRAMAASLGCKVEVLRTVAVGDCEWVEIGSSPNEPQKLRAERLWVTEALVIPAFERAHIPASTPVTSRRPLPTHSAQNCERGEHADINTEQLRIALTGSTTSGKSSLLGTLTTSTFDNGRGKSRLSLLRHRHEIASGITSSVAPELLGYHSIALSDSKDMSRTDIVNYGSSNVSSWIDMHFASMDERLVFMTDSAGHPRYLRTNIRGLVSWAPQWCICCLAADEHEDQLDKIGAATSAPEISGPLANSFNQSAAYLELCLKLDLPLIVVITKLDLASKVGLRQTLAKTLSNLKSFGRQPHILSSAEQKCLLNSIPQSDEEEVERMLIPFNNGNVGKLAPIVLTSSVTGSGIGKLHSLLHRLPIPRQDPHSGSSGCLDSPKTLFHIDEVFSGPESHLTVVSGAEHDIMNLSFILSGHLRYGELSVGDVLLVGPFTSEPSSEDARKNAALRGGCSPGHASGSPRKASLRRFEFQHLCPETIPQAEWQIARITSIRNLRLPVRRLLAGQVSTVGVTLDKPGAPDFQCFLAAGSKPRKGMVLAQPNAGESFEACSGFHASFSDERILALGPGPIVTVYIASIRASARVIAVKKTPDTSELIPETIGEDIDGLFSFGDSNSESPVRIEVVLQFLTSREWVEVGTQVLVMIGGNASLASGSSTSTSLGCFVGSIKEIMV
ncbi:hypothetical protein MMC20_006060 [Loxospora ochrophaea]|nr:hypothetical protein [Loxospora ochrophaea]